MKYKKFFIIIFLLIVLLALAIVFYFLKYKNNKFDNSDEIQKTELTKEKTKTKDVKIIDSHSFNLAKKTEYEKQNKQSSDLDTELNNNISGEVNKVKDDRVIVSQQAIFFADRFGTYSNHANFANLDDLKIMMTEKMKKWVDNQKHYSKIDNYYAISTKAIKTILKDFDDNKATVLVNTRRRETVDDTQNDVFNQDLLLFFVKKDAEQWLVDEAVWQKK